MTRPLDWARDGPSWPHHEASAFVTAGGLRWHVQRMGQGPILLLAHGTAASTHSWRDLVPLLAQRFTVVAPDLPGHAFTASPRKGRLGLDGMATDLSALMSALGLAPDLVVGHSAGAAILIRAVLDGGLAPRGIVSLNGALQPFGGFTGQVFSPLAKLLAGSPTVLRLLGATLTSRRSVERLLGETGSAIGHEGVDYYHRLVSTPSHVAAAFGMMANWNLNPLVADLPQLDIPLLLVTGSRDGSIPPEQAYPVRDRVRGARIQSLRGLGHLAHEERPAEVAAVIERFAEEVGVLRAAEAEQPSRG